MFNCWYYYCCCCWHYQVQDRNYLLQYYSFKYFFLFRWIRITVLDISLNFLKFFHTRKLLGFKTIKPFRISCIIYIFYSIRNMILKLFSFKRINILVIFWFILNRLFFLFRAKRSIRHRNHFINRNIWLLIKFLKFNLYTRI